MRFVNTPKGIALEHNGEALLTEIRVRMLPLVGQPLELTPDFSEETAVAFKEENGYASFRLTLREEDAAFSLHADGAYGIVPDPERSLHLDPVRGIGISFRISSQGTMLDAYLSGLFWQRAKIIEDICDLQTRTQSLIFRRLEDCVCLMTVCDRDFKGELEPFEGRAELMLHADDLKDQIDETVLVGACGKDPYSLPELCASYGLSVMNKPGMLRKEKEYPEIFEYLGWCSWDAFHMDVSAENLAQKAAEFRDKEIPVRWFILDDMWGDVPGNSRSSMHWRELRSWEADPARFPEGLRGCIRQLKSEFGLWVGIWHPYGGYWMGIAPDGRIAEEHPELLCMTVPYPTRQEPSRLVPALERKKIIRYFDLQHAGYHDCGADFVKIDNQGSLERFCYLQGSIGQCAANLHEAIEQVSDRYYGGALINCMGMPVENFWNRGKSAVCRFSDDFQPEDRKWFIQHLLQCSYNSLTQGTVFTGDWDMWWSDDAQARKNAVLRALSGGPIYVSDTLGRSIREVILPLAAPDGRIYRLKNPALPSADCLFTDCEHSQTAYKIFNKGREQGYLAVFNLDEEERPVNTVIALSDVRGMPDGCYCCYDRFSEECRILAPGESFSQRLENYDDFRLYLFSPVRRGIAVIGLAELYLSGEGVTHIEQGITAKQDGTLLVYAEEPPKGFFRQNGSVYSRRVKAGETVYF